MKIWALLPLISSVLILIACSKDNEQDQEPPMGAIQGKLVCEVRVGDVGFKYDLIVLDASGTYKIPSIPMLDRFSPVWSAEGDAIWYLHSTNFGSWWYQDVAVSRILDDGSQDTSLLQSNYLTGGVFDAFALSPDGNYLALRSLSGMLAIYEVVDKVQLKFLKSLESGGNDYLAWSPDSKKIAYSKVIWPDGDWDLLIYNLHSNEIKNLLPDKQSGSKISWAYSSDRIVFQSADDIFMIDADGTNLVNLTNTPDIEEQSPAFSPVEDKLIYAKMDSLHHVILIDLITGSKEVLIAGQKGSFIDYDYAYNTFTWSKEGTDFLFRHSGTSQSELRRFSFDGHKIETIFKGNIECFDWYEAP